MPVTIRPYRRFSVQYSVTYNAGPFLKLPLASCSALGYVGMKEFEWWPNNWGLAMIILTTPPFPKTHAKVAR